MSAQKVPAPAKSLQKSGQQSSLQNIPEDVDSKHPLAEEISITPLPAPTAIMTGLSSRAERRNRPNEPSVSRPKPTPVVQSPEAPISSSPALFVTPQPPPSKKSPVETHTRGAPSKPAGLSTAKGSGRGLPAKGLPRRHRKVLRDSALGVTKPDIRRLARRGGVKRISGDIYAEVRVALKERISRLIRDIVELLDSTAQKRKTVTARDVVWALKRQGSTIYVRLKPFYSFVHLCIC